MTEIQSRKLLHVNFSQLLNDISEEYSDNCCIKYITQNYTRTYKEFASDVRRFADALWAIGVRPGIKVALLATNIPEWYISFWATTMIGAIIVPINTGLKALEIEYILKNSDAQTLIVIDKSKYIDYKNVLDELCPELKHNNSETDVKRFNKFPFLRNIITLNFDYPGTISFHGIMEIDSSLYREDVEHISYSILPDSVCMIQYTSGTTGFPKGAMLTHTGIIYNGKCCGDRLRLHNSDRMLIQLPMFHTFGVSSMISALTHGATIYPTPYFSAELSLRCINTERITCVNGVPTMFISMINHENFRKTDFSSVRTGIMGGSFCPPKLMYKVASKKGMNMREIVSAYGYTEASPLCTMSSCDDPLYLRCNSVGKPLPLVQCKLSILTKNNGRKRQKIGEFCSRGYNTMKGYYKASAITDSVFDEYGWMHSGDIACLDRFGNYRIIGRLTEMINRAGENIYPAEIEKVIMSHPAVRDVQVIPIPDNIYGEQIMACIALNNSEAVDEETIRAYISKHLANYKIPKYIRFINNFPTNETGKILKSELRKQILSDF